MRGYRYPATLISLLSTVCALSLGLAACGAHQVELNSAADSLPQLFNAMPTLAEADAYSRNASAAGDAVLMHTGADYIAGLEQNVIANVEAADYAPAWSNGSSPFSAVAFAIYRFNLTDYTGEQSLNLAWAAPPTDPARVWMGCSDWTGGHWQWFAGPDASGKLVLPGSGFAPFTKSADPGMGEMLVACVVLGTQQVQLAEIRIGAPAPTGWIHSWGTDQGEEGMDIALSAAGEVYVGGYTYSTTGATNSSDCMLYKYRSSYGALQWQKSWGGDYADALWSIAVDAAGNVYGVGATSSFAADPQTGSALLLLKYAADGTLVWQKIYDSPADPNATEDGTGIAVDSTGNIYLTGSSGGFATDGFNHPLLLKIDATGNLLWQKHFAEAMPAGIGQGCTVGADGLPYLSAMGGSMASISWLIAKCGTDGVPLWQQALGPFYEEAMPQRISTDAAGNVYVAGYAYSTSNDHDALAVKLDASGVLVWQSAWGTAQLDQIYDLIADATGVVHAVGRTEQGGAGLSQALLLNLAPDGAVSAVQAGTGTDWNALYSIALGAAGELLMCGAAPDAVLSWSAANSSTAAAPAYSLTEITVLPEDVSGTLTDVTGTDAAPTGTADTGGGSDDMLVIKQVP